MCAAQSKLAPVYSTCIEYVHPWTDHCTIATAEVLLQAAQESFRIYSAVYALSLLMRFRIPTLHDLKRTFWGIIQSTCFLTTNGYTYSLILCILRHYIGSFNFYTASFVPSFIASAIALSIERPTRRGLLCLYVSNVATETLFNMACSRGYCRPIPYGQVLIFGASISVLLYYFRSGLHQRKVSKKRGALSHSGATGGGGGSHQHTQKDSIYDILRFVIGRYEEYVPPLQLQPQFLSRRRERQASAPVLMIAQHQRNDSATGHASAAATGATTSSQRRSPRNPLLPFMLRAVRYYTQAMDYFKYGLPRHKTCPHPRDSCINYVITGGAKMFTLGVGIQVTLTLIKLKMASKKPMLDQLKTLFSNSNILKLGTFLGGFATIFRLSSCSLRHITGNDDPLHGVPAALLASIAFASYPDTTVALYVFWKALQLTYNIGIDAGYLPKIPHFTFLLYSFSTAILFHAAILEPMNLRTSYWKFLQSLSGGRIAAMDRLCLDAYGLKTSQQLERVLEATKTRQKLKFALSQSF